MEKRTVETVQYCAFNGVTFCDEKSCLEYEAKKYQNALKEISYLKLFLLPKLNKNYEKAKKSFNDLFPRGLSIKECKTKKQIDSLHELVECKRRLKEEISLLRDMKRTVRETKRSWKIINDKN